MILNDAVSTFRDLVNDEVIAYRFTNAKVLTHFNKCIDDIKTKRGDLRYDLEDAWEDDMPQYPLPDDWAATTAYEIDDRVKPTSGDDYYFFVCTDPGTSGGGEPTWVYTEETDITDGTVIWQIELISLPEKYITAMAYYIASKEYENEDDDTSDASKGQFYWAKYLSEIGAA